MLSRRGLFSFIPALPFMSKKVEEELDATFMTQICNNPVPAPEAVQYWNSKNYVSAMGTRYWNGKDYVSSMGPQFKLLEDAAQRAHMRYHYCVFESHVKLHSPMSARREKYKKLTTRLVRAKMTRYTGSMHIEPKTVFDELNDLTSSVKALKF